MNAFYFRSQVRSASVRAGVTKRRKSERRVTLMVVTIVLVFIVCWLPFFTTNIVNLIHIIPKANTTIYFSLVILTYVNSCANPFLYGFLSNFRQSFEKVLCFHQKANGASSKEPRGGRRNAPTDKSNPVSLSHSRPQNGRSQGTEVLSFHSGLL